MGARLLLRPWGDKRPREGIWPGQWGTLGFTGRGSKQVQRQRLFVILSPAGSRTSQSPAVGLGNRTRTRTILYGCVSKQNFSLHHLIMMPRDLSTEVDTKSPEHALVSPSPNFPNSEHSWHFSNSSK